MPADLEQAWDTARTDGGCSVYQNAKEKLAGKPQRHLFAYLPAGFDPRVVVPNGVTPDETTAAGPRYAFATDAFGTLRSNPSGKGNIFAASFVPPIWQLWPGDVLHVRLITCVGFAPLSPMHVPVSYPQDGAPTAAVGPDACPLGSAPAKPEDFVANLHTHGLIVTPRNSLGAAQDGTGDNIFVSVPYGKKFDFRITIPPGHPSGLYWYHPHVHGVSARQVTGGMAGLIAVGDPIDLLHAPDDAKATMSDAQLQAAERAESDVRYLILKDTQIVTEDKPETGNQVITGNRLAPVDAGLCADPTQRVNQAPRDEQGICWINNPNYSWQNTDPTDPNAPKTTVSGYPVWLFTVNGERYPTYKAQPRKKSFILRISNQSASVSYDLRLVDDLDNNHAVSFELLTVDGVLAGAPQNGAMKVAPARADHIFLMPAARAEIRVSVPPVGKKYELVANDVVKDSNSKPVGLITGPGTYGSNGGDSWPYVLLARILGEAGPEGPRQVTLHSQRAELGTTAKVLGEASRMQPQLPSGCVDSLKLNGVARRIIVLTTDGDAFEMGYFKGSSHEPESRLISPTTFPHPLIWRDTKVGDISYAATPHVCIAFGEEEIWEIRNLTSELHNFHIHQAKFRMATADEIKPVTQAGVLSGDVPPNSPIAKNPVKCSEPAAGRDAPCWADPNNFMSSPAFNNIWSLNGERVMHDTFPVPPALTDATGSNPNPAIPGRVFLKLTFNIREQIGRYVYHCHILEHEDGGMMAPIEIMDTDHATGRSTSHDEPPTWIGRVFELWKVMANSQQYSEAIFQQSLDAAICKPAIH